MMKKTLLMTLVVAILAMPLFAQTQITRLRTEYQYTPMGLEVKSPRLSWQMQSDAYGAAQTAYRIVAAASEADLAAGHYTYDTGKVLSDRSVSIEYAGGVKPATRYYWKVYVWDQKNHQTVSAPTWFETGLMSTGWSGAQWIGSNETILSRYRRDFIIDFDVKALSDKAIFVWGAKDDKNYAAFVLDKAANQIWFQAVYEGKVAETGKVDVSAITGNSVKDAWHHVTLNIWGGGTNYTVAATIDGQDVGDPNAPTHTNVTFANPDVNRTTDRLDNIGFAQPAGQKAEYSNIAIRESKWGTTFTAWNDTQVADGFRVWNPVNASAPMLRKTIEVTKPVKYARFYATARGIYELEVNGIKVSDDYYNPGWPDFNERIFYNSFDITGLLSQGRNGIGATLGAGWWNDYVGLGNDPYGMAQSFLGKIVIEYVDGSRQTIVTNKSWKVYDQGPVIINGMQTGEEYDARKEVAGWSTGGFNDAGWKPVKIFDAPKGDITIMAYVGETIKNSVTLTAIEMTQPKPGVYIYDMGVNMVGIPKLTNLKGKPGQAVTLRFAEMLWPEVMPENPVAPYTLEQYRANKGLLYTDNYRSALSRDVYYMKGDATGETFEPTLVQHGYRYMEITGLDAPLALADVKGIVLESIGQQLSWYETSNKLTNQLFENIIWGQRGNFLSVPTDCPQRDERMGWTGDAQVFGLTSTYNMMTDGFWTRWMYGMRDTQGANGSYPNTVPEFGKGGDAMGWMEAGIVDPWQVYQQYADTKIIADHYESMTRYMGYLARRAKDFVQPGGLFGDWLALTPTNASLTNTAYYAYDALIMEQIARELGKGEDAAKYAELYQNIKRVFNKTFVDAQGYTIVPEVQTASKGSIFSAATIVDPEHPHRVNTQTSYIVPLYFDLFDDTNKPLAVKHLVNLLEENDYKLTTGFIGTPYLCLVLSDNGHSDVAYKLFEQTEFPSWLFPVLQGATTMWERWNSYTVREGFGPVGMNSFNHYAYGAIEEWMMKHSLGIKRDESNPGYKHFYLEPEVGGDFSFINGGFESIYGKIASSWVKKGKGYTYTCTVPANTTATLSIPALARSYVIVKKGQAGATKPVLKDGKLVYQLKAGTYEFAVK